MEGDLFPAGRSGGGAAAPRLASGATYATWAPATEDWARRLGIHKVLTTRIDGFVEMKRAVAQWEQDEDGARPWAAAAAAAAAAAQQQQAAAA